VDAEGWKSLAAGRSLLFVHGTTSMAHSAFGDLPVDFMEDMSRRYEGRVFALDHPTVSEDPRDNVKWFLEQIPDGTHLDVDIVCHSRGGLVSRILAERLSEFPMGARRLDVGRVVFVGSPNAGTNLADGRYMGSFLDTYTNMVCRLPGSMVVQALQVVLAVVKQLAFSGAEAALVGLRSMVPGGEFNAWLNDGKDHPTARYHALASSYEPSEPGLVRLANATLLGKIFDGPHDLVVPVPSVVEANGASSFPIQDRVVFQGPDSMSHVSYFGNPAVQKQLSTWLEGESRPARAMAAAT
jgi:pimeloyl-ACP methyl ester carboxylesterase